MRAKGKGLKANKIYSHRGVHTEERCGMSFPSQPIVSARQCRRCDMGEFILQDERNNIL